jgi:hypothetical protein
LFGNLLAEVAAYDGKIGGASLLQTAQLGAFEEVGCGTRR